MLNLSIFIKGLNPNADYYRQQVGERGILEQIDNINEGFLEIKDMEPKLINEIYKILDLIETSLTLNVNDPRTRMALNSFKPEPEKELEKKPVVDTEEDLKIPDTENLKGTDPDGGVTGEPGPEGPAENTEGSADETPEPTDEGTKEPTTEPTGEPDPAEKVDTTEPTDEGTKEPTGEPAGESTNETPEPTTETPEPKKGGRKKKDTE